VTPFHRMTIIVAICAPFGRAITPA